MHIPTGTRLTGWVAALALAIVTTGCALPVTSADERTTTTQSTTTTTLPPPTTTTSTTTTTLPPPTTTSSTTTTTTQPPTTTTSTTTTLPPPTTTTLPAITFVVDRPTFRPPTQPGAAPYYGSGCSPGTSTLPDGIWFGQVVSANDESLRFDLMCLEEAAPDKDYDLEWTNNNPKLRTVPVARTADVYPKQSHGWSLAPYDPRYLCNSDGCWKAWLYVNRGELTEAVPLWFTWMDG